MQVQTQPDLAAKSVMWVRAATQPMEKQPQASLPDTGTSKSLHGVFPMGIHEPLALEALRGVGWGGGN